MPRPCCHQLPLASSTPHSPLLTTPLLCWLFCRHCLGPGKHHTPAGQSQPLPKPLPLYVGALPSLPLPGPVTRSWSFRSQLKNDSEHLPTSQLVQVLLFAALIEQRSFPSTVDMSVRNDPHSVARHVLRPCPVNL